MADCTISEVNNPDRSASDGTPVLQGREERHHGRVARIRHSMGYVEGPDGPKLADDFGLSA